MPHIKAVLFDFDGTLTEPGNLDFDAIRKAIGCPAGRPILEFIRALPGAEQRAEAVRVLDRFEAEAAEISRPNHGAEDMVRSLKNRGLRLGIISRNSLASIRKALENFKRVRPEDFCVILSRDDPFAPKPDPQGIYEAARRFGLPPQEMLLVGDFTFDIEAGRRAGARTVFLSNGRLLPDCEALADHTIHNLEELEEIVRLHSALPQGKLPNDLLRRFLGDILPDPDTALLIPPAVGEDVAAVRLQGEEVLVLKSDPVTFAAEAIGHYAVTVNANDLATSGADPRWLLATLLFPPGTCAAEIREVMVSLRETADRNCMTLCGGHTEITDAVNRPVVVACACGTVEAGRLIQKKNMREGDRILFTKGVAVEGTAILARDFGEALTAWGLTGAQIEKCAALLTEPGISVLPESRIAAKSGCATAMHDVTEGGLATALEELSEAGGNRIRIFRDRIPVLEETQMLCLPLGIDPLGLIGSGSLLITCRPGEVGRLLAALREAGIDAACIGEVLGEGAGIEALACEGGKAAHWPKFPVDELARIYGKLLAGKNTQVQNGHGFR